MKANELMIGDWVMVNDIEHTHPLQVAEIFNKCGAYYATLYWDGMPDNVNPETLTADVDKVLPIPLTDEILEKNGFHEEWDEDIKLMVCDSIIVETGDNYKLYKDGKMYLRRVLAPLYYVHQLQQALRLCGIEKTIEL